MKNLYAKIQAVMKDVEYLKKDDTVQMPGSGSYKAITEEKVTESVGKAMRKHGLVIYPIEMTETRDDLQVTRSSGRQAIDRLATVNVKYKIADVESGESDIIVSAGTGIDTQDKAIGKAMTYAYKYALLRTFAIPTGEDPDKVASDDVEPATSKAAQPARQQSRQATARQPDKQPAAKQPEKQPAARQPHPAFTYATKEQQMELVRLCTNPETGKKDEEAAAKLTEIYKSFGYKTAAEIQRADFEAIRQQLVESLMLPDDMPEDETALPYDL